MPHHTKDKGDLAVFKAQADLATQGFTILHPLTEHAPFDLVVYKNRRFHRVQVRYSSCGYSGTIAVRLRTCWNDRHGTHTLSMDKEEVDIVCVYCPETNECYYFDPKMIRQSLSLRIRPTRNGQSKRVKIATDFRRVPE